MTLDTLLVLEALLSLRREEGRLEEGRGLGGGDLKLVWTNFHRILSAGWKLSLYILFWLILSMFSGRSRKNEFSEKLGYFIVVTQWVNGKYIYISCYTWCTSYNFSASP